MIMKKIKIIENGQINFHPEQVLSETEMKNVHGGFCFCDKNRFGIDINGTSIDVCDDNCFVRIKKESPSYAE